MKNALIFGCIGVLLGFSGGHILYNQNEKAAVTDPHGAMAAKHAELAVDTTLPLPSVSVKAIPDSKDGYNLHIVTQNFTFTPEKVGTAPTNNEGHAHLFVNGVKVARVYGNWFSLSASVLKDGENEIEVTLNANDHSEWVLGGVHIAAKVMVTK